MTENKTYTLDEMTLASDTGEDSTYDPDKVKIVLSVKDWKELKDALEAYQAQVAIAIEALASASKHLESMDNYSVVSGAQEFLRSALRKLRAVEKKE